MEASPVRRDNQGMGDAAASTDPRLPFGLRVRALRLARDLSQEELADRCGLHPTYISGIERGRRNISLLNIYRLAAALGLPPGDLLPVAPSGERER